MAQRSQRGSPLPLALAVLVASVLIHLLMLPLGNMLLRFDWASDTMPLPESVLDVALLPDPAPEDPAKPEQLDERRPPGKLVQVDRVLDERAPEETDRVSEFDSRVDREQRAPLRRPSEGAAATEVGDRPDATDAKQPSPTPNDLASRALSLAQRMQAAAEQGAEAYDASEPVARGELPQTPGAAAPAVGGVQGLRGSPDAMRQAFGTPGTFDDLANIDEGNENLLNSRRWKFASFFNRMRDAVAQHWEPAQVHHAQDPNGRVYGLKPRTTRLWIRLNPDGSVHEIRLDRTSAAPHLDEEAIRAVRAAAPFTNPPPQLVNPTTGLIEVGFTFILDFDGGARIFRYRQ